MRNRKKRWTLRETTDPTICVSKKEENGVTIFVSPKLALELAAKLAANQ
jgi:hypothetical protein